MGTETRFLADGWIRGTKRGCGYFFQREHKDQLLRSLLVCRGGSGHKQIVEQRQELLGIDRFARHVRNRLVARLAWSAASRAALSSTSMRLRSVTSRIAAATSTLSPSRMGLRLIAAGDSAA